MVRIQRIRNVRLDNNPLICDECHMGKLINVVQHVSTPDNLTSKSKCGALLIQQTFVAYKCILQHSHDDRGAAGAGATFRTALIVIFLFCFR